MFLGPCLNLGPKRPQNFFGLLKLALPLPYLPSLINRWQSMIGVQLINRWQLANCYRLRSANQWISDNHKLESSNIINYHIFFTIARCVVYYHYILIDLCIPLVAERLRVSGVRRLFAFCQNKPLPVNMLQVILNIYSLYYSPALEASLFYWISGTKLRVEVATAIALIVLVFLWQVQIQYIHYTTIFLYPPLPPNTVVDEIANRWQLMGIDNNR